MNGFPSFYTILTLDPPSKKFLDLPLPPMGRTSSLKVIKLARYGRGTSSPHRAANTATDLSRSLTGLMKTVPFLGKYKWLITTGENQDPILAILS